MKKETLYRVQRKLKKELRILGSIASNLRVLSREKDWDLTEQHGYLTIKRNGVKEKLDKCEKLIKK